MSAQGWPPGPPAYRPDIDGLRAVSVLLVMGFHAFPQAVSGGFVGVDVFFVISGYLISGILLADLAAGRFSFAGFYARRIRRIFPALALVLGAALAAGWVFLMPDEYGLLGKHAAGGAAFISNFLLAREVGYFDTAAHAKPLLHLWSLAIEEQFYAVWPLALFAAWRFRVGLLNVVLAILAASFLLSVAMAGKTAWGFYSPLARLWELMLGGALAWLAAHGEHRLSRAMSAGGATLANAKAAAGLALILAAGFGLRSTNAYPGGWALLPAAGALLVISAGPGAWANRVLLSRPAVVWIGLISYPLYLWHWPLLSFLGIVAPAASSPLTKLAALLAAALLAALTYLLLEKPLRARANVRALALLLAGVMAATGIAGYAAYRSGGAPGRLPEAARELTTFNYRDKFGEIAREGSCLLRQDQGPGDFGECVDPPVPGEELPLVLLWGDSHGAHLYPGLRALAAGRLRVAQFTASACPPILRITMVAHADCAAINAHVLAVVAKQRPARVLLAAQWSSTDWGELPLTIAELKKRGVARVTVIGPAPRWNETLPRLMYRAVERDRLQHRWPERLAAGFNPSNAVLDRMMRPAVEAAGAEYVSLEAMLCNPSGCLTRVGEGPDKLVVWDISHFTRAGSESVVARFPGLPR